MGLQRVPPCPLNSCKLPTCVASDAHVRSLILAASNIGNSKCRNFSVKSETAILKYLVKIFMHLNYTTLKNQA